MDLDSEAHSGNRVAAAYIVRAALQPDQMDRGFSEYGVLGTSGSLSTSGDCFGFIRTLERIPYW